MPFHNSDSYPSSTRNRANGQHTRIRSLLYPISWTIDIERGFPVEALVWVSTNSALIWPFLHLAVLRDSFNPHGGGMTGTDTPSASERTYRAFPRTRPITARASGKWTTARHLIGYPLTNTISHTPLARRMPFLGAISALDWGVIYNKHVESIQLNWVFSRLSSGFQKYEQLGYLQF